MWPLTLAWYGDRLSPDYRPRFADQVREMLAAAGLVDDFWRL